MKKIGIILNRDSYDRYLYEIIKKLTDSPNIKLYFLKNREIEKKSLKLNFFKLITRIESIFISLLNPTAKVDRESFTIDSIYEEIDTIKSLDLDLIISTSLDIPKSLIDMAKDGIIYINYSYGKTPQAFWEVYHKKPSSQFTIERLTTKSTTPQILLQGAIQTQRSYTENRVYLFSNSTPYLSKMVVEYATTNRLPLPKTTLPIGEPNSTIPTILQSLSYIIKTKAIIFWTIVKRLILKRQRRWGVAFIKSNWHNLKLKDGIEIKNPPNRYFADPFVVTREKRSICFVEDYYYDKAKASITAVELVDNSYNILGTIIDEPFHLSYPFVFEYQDELYMVPESCESSSIRLYRCIEYPMRWEYQKDVISNIDATDTIIFEHENRWWLLCNTSIDGNSDYSATLMAFYSNSPLSNNWIPHTQNPLVFDSTIARNGGGLNLTADTLPIRSRQRQGFNEYGEGFSLAQIDKLTPTDYQEREIARFTPEFFQNIKACHHIHSDGIYTVYDYMRWESLK
jgi:hypothetical protein